MEHKSARVLSETLTVWQSQLENPIQQVTVRSGQDYLHGEFRNSSTVNKSKGSRERKATGVKDRKVRAAGHSLNNATQNGVRLLFN